MTIYWIEKDRITDVPGMPRDPFGCPTASCDPPDVQLIREGSLDEVDESSIGFARAIKARSEPSLEMLAGVLLFRFRGAKRTAQFVSSAAA